jgi:signal transduction histidine kinase
MRPQRWAAALLAATAVLLAGGTAVLVAVLGTGVTAGSALRAGLPAAQAAAARPGVPAEFPVATAAGLALAALGLVIAWRVAGPIGPLLAWAGATVTFAGARPAYETVRLARPDVVPMDVRVLVLFEESVWWLLVAAALVLLYFPDGRLPGPRWRWVPWGLIAAGAVQQAYGIVQPDPLLGPLAGLPRPYPPPGIAVEVVSVIALAGLIGLAMASAVSLVVRFRRSHGVRRAQLKWLIPAGAAVVTYPLVCLAEIILTGGTGPVAVVAGVAAVVSFPVALTIGMLRHDLYDVDRVLAASITYAIVTLALLAVFVVSIVTAGLLLGRDSALAAAVATAACAVVLAPLRRRLARAVDDRFYPPRRAAQDAIAALQRRISAGRAQPEELEATLRVALRDPALRVGVRIPGTQQMVDVTGEPVAAGEEPGRAPAGVPRAAVPVLLADEPVGVLAGTDEAVLRAVAPGTAALIDVIRLRASLADALREVRESRTRIVQAGNAERVRLERDLHDGAQQRLVSLGMALRIAQMQRDRTDIDGVLDRAVAELGTAVAELRQIAHGLRPASLDDGLHAALSGMARSLPFPVRLHVDPATLPDDLATTAYYVACEAVTNAAKHAGADQVAVRVAHEDHTVRIRVEDDGCGGATVRAGSGLAGLTDRVAALGGSLTMRSPAGGGTVIEAVLPCGS